MTYSPDTAPKNGKETAAEEKRESAAEAKKRVLALLAKGKVQPEMNLAVDLKYPAHGAMMHVGRFVSAEEDRLIIRTILGNEIELPFFFVEKIYPNFHS